MPTTRVGDLNMHYEVLGDGPPLLMVMGLASSLMDWGSVVPARLAGNRKVILFDNRGAGRTDHPAGPYTMPQLAADAVGLLDALDIERADVFGVSMGGMIAQHLVLDYPDRVDRLVLGCTQPGGRRVVPARPEVLALLTPVPGMDPVEARWLAQPILHTAGYIDTNRDALMERIRETAPFRSPVHALDAQLGAIGRTHDVFDRLGEIRAPTLVVTGTEDVLIPPVNSRILAERIPGATLREILGAAHLFWDSHPDRTVEILKAFLT